MKIKTIYIQNFRRLKTCRIDIGEKETIFVGANNSGKTSAMNALSIFLSEKKFTTKDFTISNWLPINKIGESWIDKKNDENELSIDKWDEYLPKLDIWFNVGNNELHYVSHIIPTLDWESGALGVRLRLEPKNISILCKDFISSYGAAQDLKNKTAENNREHLKLYPTSLWDFLDKGNKINEYFSIVAYVLDPTKLDIDKDIIQKTPSSMFDGDPLRGLVKIDIIDAQRGFSDPNSKETNIDNLSVQLREYYSKHLSPENNPDESDLDALESIATANETFDKKLQKDFAPSIRELETLNYPGLGNPKILLSSKINPVDGLKHESSVQFCVLKSNSSDVHFSLHLSERYNGLGYQNLISMFFKLIRFRDDWMKVGKLKNQIKTTDDIVFEPLHIVLIEEPEAHLHAQVQQVFIRKAYNILRDHPNLGTESPFTTQLIVSTHSNHIAHEVDFETLRYFKRNVEKGKLPISTVVNLSTTFGTKITTAKFVTRYLKTTHCDLFFADAVIMVEGAAERMFMPFFIKEKFADLSSAYISILEINGSHAHTLRPLIEDLGILTLIITDLDSTKDGKSILPRMQDGQVTDNDTLKSWIPQKKTIDDLSSLAIDQKEAMDGRIRVAYQYPLDVKYNKKKAESVIPYTFEDAFVFENLEIFKSITGSTGLISKFTEAVNEVTLAKAAQMMYEELRKGSKAKFAVEMLFSEDVEKLSIPQYIKEGLEWLKMKINESNEINL